MSRLARVGRVLEVGADESHQISRNELLPATNCGKVGVVTATHPVDPICRDDDHGLDHTLLDAAEELTGEDSGHCVIGKAEACKLVDGPDSGGPHCLGPEAAIRGTRELSDLPAGCSSSDGKPTENTCVFLGLCARADSNRECNCQCAAKQRALHVSPDDHSAYRRFTLGSEISSE